MKSIIRSFCMLVYFTLAVIPLKAQLSGGNVFLKGNYVEIGVSGSGGFEGANSPAPIGYHFTRGISGLSAIVADPDSTLWTNWDGDFCTAGSPENGWGITVGDSTSGVLFSNDADPRFILGSSVPSNSLITYNHIGTNSYANWHGAITSSSLNLKVNIIYTLGDNDSFYKTTVSIKNDNLTMIPCLYYYRNIDPDNNQYIFGSYFTTNLVEKQCNIPLGNNLSLVSARQTSTVSNHSYISLVGIGSNFKVTRGGFFNRNGYNIWNEITPINGTVGVPVYADEAISLANKITNLLPGETRSFEFLTIFDSLSICSALSSLVYLSKDGITPLHAEGSTYSDTIYTCGNNPTIQILGPNVNDFTWNWTPSTFLSSATSTSATISPTSAIVYTITGVPTATSGILCPSAKQFVIIVIPTSSASPILANTTNTLICNGITSTLTAIGGLTYTWNPTYLSGSSIIVSPSVTTVYTVTSSDSNHCNAVNYVTQYVNPISTITANTSDTMICRGITSTLTATGGLTYTWNPTYLSGSSIVVSPSVTTVYTVTSSDSNHCNAVNYVTQYVNPISTITANTSDTMICRGISSTLTATGGLTYTWNPTYLTGASIVISPIATTVYTVTSTDINNCNTVSYVTQNVADCTGINEFENNSYLKIYPNPAQNEITIEMRKSFDAIKISVYNVLGELVLQEDVIAKNLKLNISSLNNGIYFIEAVNQKNTSVRTKFVKE